jgi:hypothetical protein
MFRSTMLDRITPRAGPGGRGRTGAGGAGPGRAGPDSRPGRGRVAAGHLRTGLLVRGVENGFCGGYAPRVSLLVARCDDMTDYRRAKRTDPEGNGVTLAGRGAAD